MLPALALSLLLSPPAAAATDSPRESDPLEPFNRVIFQFNEGLRTLFLRPAFTFIEAFTPPALRDHDYGIVSGVDGILDNLTAPVVLVNDLLQGEGRRALRTTQRFAINTTVGIGGLFDVASMAGIEGHQEDFGQTLAVWGIDEGAFMVLPLIGPTNPRDGVGALVDGALDPFSWYLTPNRKIIAAWARTGTAAGKMIGAQEDGAADSSGDLYASVRDQYRRQRFADIHNVMVADLPTGPDIRWVTDGEAIPDARQTWTRPADMPVATATTSVPSPGHWAPTVTFGEKPEMTAEAENDGWAASVSLHSQGVALAFLSRRGGR